MTLAASGSCGWFAAVKKTVKVVRPPPSEWRTVENELGEISTSITHDYSDEATKTLRKLPMLLDYLSVFVSGVSFLLVVVQTQHFLQNGILGIKIPLYTFCLRNVISSAFVVTLSLLSWEIDYFLIGFHFGRILWAIGLVSASERFPEEHFFVYGFFTTILGVWSSMSSFQGAAPTAFYERDVAASMTPRCVCMCCVCVCVGVIEFVYIHAC